MACLIFVFVSGGTLGYTETAVIDETVLEEIARGARGTPVATVIDRLIEGLGTVQEATSLGSRSREGVISAVYRSSLKAGGINNAFLARINNTIFNGKFNREAIVIVGTVLSFLFKIFVAGIINIGVWRLFLEARLYPNTSLTKLLFIFRRGRFLRIASIVFATYARLFLWALTIVGFPIQYYAYRLVPFIAAENPEISRTEVFRLSARMMRGNKFRFFLFDLSFMGWILMSVFTFGLLNYLWLNPYMRAAKAELYAVLRTEAKSKALEGTAHLCDTLLFEPFAGALPESCGTGVYPTAVSGERRISGRPWIYLGAKDRYSLINLVLMFFLFAFIGWIWECSLDLVSYGIFVNRGSLYGPWIPIYGFGGLSILLLLTRLHRRPVLCFFMAVTVCGVIEYVGATLLWHIPHVKYWDYSGYFFNTQGRVCLEGLLTFGILGMVGLYFIAPLTDDLLNRLPPALRRLICACLCAVFCVDVVFAQAFPHVGPGITSEVAGR
ncbi:MAG: DUF975 family protein [Clostridiales Family XIII bacterium]|nr:DUF975 family protein [Clostridiales Family XIII bacterium]